VFQGEDQPVRNAFPVIKEFQFNLWAHLFSLFIVPKIDKIGILLQEMLEADLLIIIFS